MFKLFIYELSGLFSSHLVECFLVVVLEKFTISDSFILMRNYLWMLTMRHALRYFVKRRNDNVEKKITSTFIKKRKSNKNRRKSCAKRLTTEQ